MIVDLGCGTGRFSELLAAEFEARHRVREYDRCGPAGTGVQDDRVHAGIGG
jgi:hypothetical protein